MKKLSSLLLALMFLVSGMTFAQNTTITAPKTKPAAVQSKPVKEQKTETAKTATSGPMKKDGTPDKRYKENKKMKKDGTPDKRYKENKTTPVAK